MGARTDEGHDQEERDGNQEIEDATGREADSFRGKRRGPAGQRSEARVPTHDDADSTGLDRPVSAYLALRDDVTAKAAPPLASPDAEICLEACRFPGTS